MLRLILYQKWLQSLQGSGKTALDVRVCELENAFLRDRKRDHKQMAGDRILLLTGDGLPFPEVTTIR